MGELFQRVRDQITKFYQSLDKKKKIWLAVGSLFVVFVIVGILMLIQPEYVVLASDIELEDMQAIVNKLDEKGIKHKEESMSNVVMVDVKDLTTAKMLIASELQLNIPDYTWTDVFANTSFTMTSEVRAQQIMQAKASQLSMGIENNIQGVEKAVVDLYIAPDTSFLLDDSDESRVGVILVLDGGFEFNQNQVSGIVSFIMNTVPNLPKENITIVDETGQTLNRFSEDSDAFLAATQYEQTKTVEKQLEDKLNNFLGALYGRTHVRIMASVTLDFDEYSSQSTKFSPPIEGATEGMVLSMTTLSESVSSGGTASGVAGTDSNTEITDYPSGDDGTDGIEKASKTVNYAMNEIVEVLNKAQGSIEYITISVIVDESILENNLLTEEDESNIIDVVTSAAGLETKAVTVISGAFSEDAMGLERYSSSDANVGPGIPLWLVGIIIGVLLVGVIIFFVLSKRKAEKSKAQEIAEVQATEAEKHQSELEEISMDVEDKSSPKYQIEKFIEAKPEAVAALLRSWMSDM